MNIYEFMSDSPFLTFFITFAALCLIQTLVKCAVVAIKGYPPPHCDAEGDKVSSEDED